MLRNEHRFGDLREDEVREAHEVVLRVEPSKTHLEENIDEGHRLRARQLVVHR